MSRRLITNNAYGTTVDAIGGATTQFSVSSTVLDNFPTPTVDDLVLITVQSSGGVLEIMKLTDRTAAMFTVERAQEGTSAQAFPAGAVVELRATASAFNGYGQLANDEEVSGAWNFANGLSSGGAAVATEAYADTKESQADMTDNGNETYTFTHPDGVTQTTIDTRKSMEDLQDVEILTEPDDRSILVYDTSDDKWKPDQYVLAGVPLRFRVEAVSKDEVTNYVPTLPVSFPLASLVPDPATDISSLKLVVGITAFLVENDDLYLVIKNQAGSAWACVTTATESGVGRSTVVVRQTTGNFVPIFNDPADPDPKIVGKTAYGTITFDFRAPFGLFQYWEGSYSGAIRVYSDTGQAERIITLAGGCSCPTPDTVPYSMEMSGGDDTTPVGLGYGSILCVTGDVMYGGRTEITN